MEKAEVRDGAIYYSAEHVEIAGKTFSTSGVAYVEPDLVSEPPRTYVAYIGGPEVYIDAPYDEVLAALGIR